ncbi:MAG TPA: hypothetical protein VHI52_09325, partial [Verrucomicrobiae bacterium]|nr:hypothetical protein [Verrucomicrobiae bacterium]
IGSNAAQTPFSELASVLTNLDLSAGRLSPEQAAQVRESFRSLAARGDAAVPLIKTLLDQKVDVKYGKGSGDTVGVPSLRAGLLETLRQIGSPDAIALSRQVLENSSDPMEIALLARNLEGVAPGQYRQDLMNVTLASLNAAAQDQKDASDVSPLFQTLQAFGDTNVVGTLTSMASKYGYYADLALAGLPAGQGVSALTQMAQDSSASGAGNRQFALQMLAQVAAQYPEATSALVELARQNQVPQSAWGAIAAVLAGQQFQFPRSYPENMFATVNGPDLRTHYQAIGNQTFLSMMAPAEASAQTLNQRLNLLEQLSAATTDPAALQALQAARAKLTASPGPK